MTYYIKADKFFYPYHTLSGGYLEIKAGKFGKHMQEVPEDTEVKDYTGYWIALRIGGYTYTWFRWRRCDGRRVRIA